VGTNRKQQARTPPIPASRPLPLKAAGPGGSAPSATRRRRRPADLGAQLDEALTQVELLQQRVSQLRLELRESRDRYDELFDFAPTPYALLTPSGVVSEINLDGCALLGVSRLHLVGRPLVGAVHPEDIRLFLDHMRRCRAEPGPAVTELRVITRGGTVVPLQLTSQRSHARTETRFHTMLYDLSDRQRMEAARLQWERDRERAAADARVAQARADSKDQFIAVISHELRTPLTPVLLAARDLARRTDVEPDVRRLLDIIHRNAVAEARLIDDLLDAARTSVGRLRLERGEVDLHQAIGEVVESLKDEIVAQGLSLGFELAAQRPVVSADAGRLRQVFANLLNNAIKFTPAGGRVRLASSDQPDGWVRVEVTDTGIGIQPEVLPRLFEPFEQGGRTPGVASRSGLGLGLSICRGIVQRHGGRIWAESGGTGTGATFVVELPNARPEGQPPASTPAPSDAEDVEPRRLLLVEDDEDTATMVAALLDGQGYRVTVSHSLEQARSVAQEPWDAVVSDISLPDGSGLELLGLGDGVRSAATRIALSGFGSPGDMAASREAGYTAHLVKPVGIDQLLQVLRGRA